MVLDALQQMKLTAHTNAEKYVDPPPSIAPIAPLPVLCLPSPIVLVSDPSV